MRGPQWQKVIIARPGAEDLGANATDSVEIEGTSDTTTDACRRLSDVADVYATKYNETITGLQGATAPPALSCSSEIGASAASKLVQQCLQVSPATHPPCEAENSCAMIESEIKRGCDYIGKGQPGFCRHPDH